MNKYYLVILGCFILGFVIFRVNDSGTSVQKSSVLESNNHFHGPAPAASSDSSSKVVLSNTKIDQAMSVLDMAGPEAVEQEKSAIKELKKHKASSAQEILNLWRASNNNHKEKMKLVYLMGEVNSPLFINTLRNFVEEDIEKQIQGPPLHLDDPREQIRIGQSLALEALQKISPQDLEKTLQTVISNCDRSSRCFNAVQKAKEIGWNEQKILSVLPSDFQSINF